MNKQKQNLKRKNINTPEYWDTQFEREWMFLHDKVNPRHVMEYRWDGMRYGMLSKGIPFKGKLLDIGCGLGHFCRYIRARNIYIEPYGIDISPKAIEYSKKLAKKTGMKMKFKMGDAENIPYPDNYFDFVVAQEVIEHVDSPARVLNEIKRVLKLGGEVYITTPVRGIMGDDEEGLCSPEHVQEWTPNEFVKLVERIFGWGRIAFPPSFKDMTTGIEQTPVWFMCICRK